MEHFDEHSLELFVLNAPEIQNRKAAIQDHLKECHGCKELTNRMVEFHSELEYESRVESHDLPAVETALIHARHTLEPFSGFAASPTTYNRVPFPGESAISSGATR